ncbi:sortase domain-containing protein [Nocardioides alkalitolerans]|uniref:sortase domain-containing protein n=1 Tax=Nocardioides alkalitolerans TaxID=281714 RepID=UPI0004041D09|nr:sortase [Nocardioides alkalitolerans]
MTRLRAAALLLSLPLLTACGGEGAETGATGSTPSGSPSATSSAPPAPTSTPTTPEAPAPTTPAGPRASDGTPQPALLTIPSLDLVDLEVVPYVGFTDDAPGTEIQNDGRAASPYGERGGTGPGGIGNYQVTAHRLSSTRAFEFLPDLVDGDVVHVAAGGATYTYEIVETRQTSFRSEASLAAQRAAVPGQPGVAPTRAMITLSTCRTTEDHAEGNYWSDEFDNPEHRIDKIGVLVEVTGA